MRLGEGEGEATYIQEHSIGRKIAPMSNNIIGDFHEIHIVERVSVGFGTASASIATTASITSSISGPAAAIPAAINLSFSSRSDFANVYAFNNK